MPPYCDAHGCRLAAYLLANNTVEFQLQLTNLNGTRPLITVEPSKREEYQICPQMWRVPWLKIDSFKRQNTSWARDGISSGLRSFCGL